MRLGGTTCVVVVVVVVVRSNIQSARVSGSEEHKSSVVGNDQVIRDQQKYYEDYYG